MTLLNGSTLKQRNSKPANGRASYLKKRQRRFAVSALWQKGERL
jgi:hypothetical protein